MGRPRVNSSGPVQAHGRYHDFRAASKASVDVVPMPARTCSGPCVHACWHASTRQRPASAGYLPALFGHVTSRVAVICRCARASGQIASQQKDGLPDDRSSDLASEDMRGWPLASDAAPAWRASGGAACWPARPGPPRCSPRASRCWRRRRRHQPLGPAHRRRPSPPARSAVIDCRPRARRADPDRHSGPGRRDGASAQLGAQISGVIRNDLGNCGLFRPIDQAAFIQGGPAGPAVRRGRRRATCRTSRTGR